MSALARQIRLPAALACLLALLLLWEVLPPTPPPPAPLLAGNPPATTASGTTAEAGAWMAQILGRPLFRADRRPLAELPASADLSPPRLTAIVITATGASAVFINADGSTSVLAAGGHSGLYQVLAITAAGVRLGGPEGTLNLRPLFAPDASADSADTATPPPQPAPNLTAARAQDSQ